MKILTFSAPDRLDLFSQTCAKELFDGDFYDFKFPDECYLGNWSEKKILEKNESFLNGLRDKANVYLISMRIKGTQSKWKRMYIGQRKRQSMRERIIQHLIKKHEKTGSALSKVQDAVRLGNEIRLSFINVDPDSLRRTVEEIIIKNNKKKGVLDWNRHC